MDEFAEWDQVITVIPARMSSSRLPGKVLLPLGETTVLDQVIRRVRAAGCGEPVIALPDGEPDRPLRQYCHENRIRFCSGSEEDVMGRLYDAALQANARWIVRCQASQPLVDPGMLLASLQYVQQSGMDVVTVGGMPSGVGGEAFPLRTLENLRRMSGLVRSRGRASSLLNTLTTSFERAILPSPARLRRPELRLSLETEDDYWLMKRLYDEVAPRRDGLIAVDDVIHYIESAPDLMLYATDSIAVIRAA
jgi:spore coat polysaccharide biosynthesis protein SpsF